jgi:AcrR family transcriptional regulator
MNEDLAGPSQVIYVSNDMERLEAMALRGRPRTFDRDEALGRAMDLFWRQGFDSTSLSQLTEAMGLNPPSLYAAFGSKEELFKEALDLYTRSEGAGIWEPVPDAATAREAVAGMLRATARAYTRGPGKRGCMVVLAAPQMQGGNPAVYDELKRRRRQNVAILQARLERAVMEGEVAPDADCRAIADYYATLQHGMSIQARDGASRERLLAVADCAMAGWDSLVGVKPARARRT